MGFWESICKFYNAWVQEACATERLLAAARGRESIERDRRISGGSSYGTSYTSLDDRGRLTYHGTDYDKTGSNAINR